MDKVLFNSTISSTCTPLHGLKLLQECGEECPWMQKRYENNLEVLSVPVKGNYPRGVYLPCRSSCLSQLPETIVQVIPDRVR